jgi:hypothetical protein
MPVNVNRTFGPNDRCSPGGAVISALLCAVVEGDAIVGWMENSGFMVREVGVDGTLPPLDLKPAALALDAQNFDTKAAAAGVVGIHADQVLEDEQIVAAVYEALARRHPKKAFSPRPAPSYSCSCASEECRLHTPSISLT